MNDEKIATREEKLAPLIAKAWQDEAYKKELLADPKAVLLKEFGVELPAEVSVEVMEESSSKLFIVLPAKPSGELTDEQLEAVAGGVCMPIVIVASVIFATTAGVATGKLIQQRGW